MSARVVAIGATSALGRGASAYGAGEVGAAARVAIREDAELRGAAVSRPWCARAPIAPDAGDDRAIAVFRDAWTQTIAELDRAWPAWRGFRCGAAIGTSSGGMRSAESLFDAIARGERPGAELVGRAAYFTHPDLAIELSPASLVLSACASSTIAIGLGARWLELGACDVVIAGGYDAVSVFVAAGFDALKATASDGAPRPFRKGRDGLALGEGAAFVALTRRSDAPARVFVRGFCATSDGVHITAPDREGSGLARAARGALAEAGLASVDLVSAHGTATPYNDAAEARALGLALGAGRQDVVVHPFKAQIGHTLGAAGALEAACAIDAMERGVLPAAAGAGELDPDAAVRLLATNARAEVRSALKLSAAFGGANAAIVLAREDGGASRPAPRDAFVSRAVRVDALPSLESLAELTGQSADRLARADELTRLALAAVGRLAQAEGSLAGAGVVVGHALATLETNALFWKRIRERGARAAEPRRFPYTSPNAVAGDCGIAFGLTGPSFAVGFGPHGALEALVVASDLVRAHDADRLVVVAVDHVDAATAALDLPFSLHTGAIALLVSSAPGVLRVGETRLSMGAGPIDKLANGHRALASLLEPAAGVLEGGSPWGGFASIALCGL